LGVFPTGRTGPSDGIGTAGATAVAVGGEDAGREPEAAAEPEEPA
jgi:hypothetical protein